VFPVKYRKALLDEVVERIIVETARGKEERYDIEFEQLGCARDHIHILSAVHPKVTPGQIVRIAKSSTVREIFRGNPPALAGVSSVGYQVTFLPFRAVLKMLKVKFRNTYEASNIKNNSNNQEPEWVLMEVN